MSSDILSVIAREPKRKLPPRPASPKASMPRSRLGVREDTPTPPESPPPQFRSHGRMPGDRFEDFSNDIRPEDSVSNAGSNMRAASPDSVLLDAMRNDEPEEEFVPIQPPPPGVRPPSPVRAGYAIADYTEMGMGGTGVLNGQPVQFPLQVPTGPAPPEQQFQPAYQQQQQQQQQAHTQPVAPHVYQVDPVAQAAADREARQEKDKLLAELMIKKARGHDVPPHIGVHTDIDDLRSLAEGIRKLENNKRTIAMLRYLMILACTGVEKATMKFVSDMYLDGWAESIAANQNDYDDVLGRIADTMDLGTSIPPHVELVAMLGVSGVMFHMAQKSKVQAEKHMALRNRRPPAPAPQPARVPMPPPTQQTRPQSPPPQQGLTEEQLRIHNLITGTVAAPHEYAAEGGKRRYEPMSSVNSVGSPEGSVKTRKRGKIQVDADDIVRLFD